MAPGSCAGDRTRRPDNVPLTSLPNRAQQWPCCEANGSAFSAKPSDQTCCGCKLATQDRRVPGKGVAWRSSPPAPATSGPRRRTPGTAKRALGCVSRVPLQSSRIPGQRRLPAFLASASLSCSHSRAARWLQTSRTPHLSRNCDRPFPGFLRPRGHDSELPPPWLAWRPRGTRCWLGRSLVACSPIVRLRRQQAW
jgi:hypothetical protein